MLKKIHKFIFLFFFTLPSLVQAVENVEIQALMPGMVVLLIDGDRTTLKAGQMKQGVKLISSTTSLATLEIEGKRKAYKMGSSISTQFSKREEITERVMLDKHGMFRVHGSINGQSVQFLVDTGATSVAMSAKTARGLGIQYQLNGIPTKTSTASGIADAWSIKLKTVRLGQLLVRNVQGVVIDGNHPRMVLLGMSFLKQMKVEKEGRVMKISRKP
ncbi:hypothetical protein MNBD_GAMMA07-2158 [hydrothermal vent metagenome]|uniref:TIGR02281 family clan AA aspartic protease n=1 Tax=hydrothermal vent metagenome TaxID=652676 RepID=A0A3B0WJZ8_9ZZZZ